VRRFLVLMAVGAFMTALEIVLVVLLVLWVLSWAGCAHPADRLPRPYSLDSGSGKP